MSEVQFFYQERFDGGRRSGITVDGYTVLHGFVDGTGEHDPALEWYIDVASSAATPPTEENARAWLDDNGQVIRSAIDVAAERLECGIDSGMPWEVETPGPDGPTRVSVSAVRRLTGRAIGGRLRELVAKPWNVLFPAAASTR